MHLGQSASASPTPDATVLEGPLLVVLFFTKLWVSLLIFKLQVSLQLSTCQMLLLLYVEYMGMVFSFVRTEHRDAFHVKK